MPFSIKESSINMQDFFLQIILPILLRGDLLQKDGQELGHTQIIILTHNIESFMISIMLLPRLKQVFTIA